MEKIAAPQLESFNYAIGEGLKLVVKNISPKQRYLSRHAVTVSISEAVVQMTSVPEKKARIPRFPIYPKECRLCGHNYSGDLIVKLLFESKDGEFYSKRVFQIPIMVKSDVCILQNGHLNQREEVTDPGGYFIINGKERMFRTYLMKHRNYPFAIIRKSWKKKVQNLTSKNAMESYTEFGVQIRCVSKDETNSTVTLRYLSDCSVNVSFVVDGFHHFVSLMLIFKVLGSKYTDKYIYQRLLIGGLDNFSISCIKNMMRKLQSQSIYTHTAAKLCLNSGLGKYLKLTEPIADYVIRECILIHLEDKDAKFNLLCFMLKKLMALVQGKCHCEQPSSFVYQELLLSGQLYLMLLKFELKNYLRSVASLLNKKFKDDKKFLLNQGAVDYCTTKGHFIGAHIASALSTGNIPAEKLGLTQASGCSVLCDRTNILRFCSHFTRVEKVIIDPYSTDYLRRFQPEAWGYLCPMHTPDGKETGIKNYLSQSCRVTPFSMKECNITESVISLGAIRISECTANTGTYPVLIDGEVVGFLSSSHVLKFVKKLRSYRNSGRIYKYAEIIHLPFDEHCCIGQIFYSGIFIFTSAGRMMRPIQNCRTGKVNHICVFEQACLSVMLHSQKQEEINYTHKEFPFENLQSDVVSSVPFFEFNPSPRNILSCQMAKQALGMPMHSLLHRADSKIYQLVYPQAPVVTTVHCEENGYNEYPIGINSVVAVISYTGFDMEDAIILNKSSVERGLANVVVFNSVTIDLQQIAKEMSLKHAHALIFAQSTDPNYFFESLDADGLPYIGMMLNYGDVLCCYMETMTGKVHTEKYQYHELGYIQDVKLLGNYTTPLYLTKVMIKLRILRTVEVGDKFASRHGQKGVMGRLWSSEDMPFTDGGVVPDILINPHSFPSRMTIGMFIESMAGKVASAKAEKSVIAQFQFTRKKSTASAYFGEKLMEAGFNFYGTETMYSGVSGQELQAEIFIGVVYYQRLRHMVADKYQMRSLGIISHNDQQPIKGSPKDGAIRFGEMERDATIGHGTAFLLQDRLVVCSDQTSAYYCPSCLTISPDPLTRDHFPQTVHQLSVFTCKICQERLIKIKLPFVYFTLAAELSACGIKLCLR